MANAETPHQLIDRPRFCLWFAITLPAKHERSGHGLGFFKQGNGSEQGR
jgi:hypothetical protein